MSDKNSLEEDYVFRFQLSEVEEVYYKDRYTEMIRQQIVNLLDIVVLTQNGEECQVNGFKFHNDIDNNYIIWTKKD